MRRLVAAAVASLAAVAAAGAATPSANPAPRPLTVGAYYYTWYGPDRRHWDKGYARALLDTPQLPVLGEYDSRDPEVIAAHYRWAQRYGVDLFIASWWGRDGWADVTLRDHVLPSPARRGTRIALLYESTLRLGLTENRVVLDDDARQRLLDDFDYLARTYLRHPAYYRVRGRPVVFLYVSRIYRGDVAGTIRELRAHVRARHGLDLYLVGDEADWDLGPARSRIRLYDAITGYTLYSTTQRPGWPSETRFLDAAGATLRTFRRAAAAERVAFVPNVQPAFNDRGVRPEASHWVLPHEVGPAARDFSLFRSFLRVAAAHVDPRLNLLTVTSWNEWHEDTQIEPTAAAQPSGGAPEVTAGYTYRSYGVRLLEILAAVKRGYARG